MKRRTPHLKTVSITLFVAALLGVGGGVVAQSGNAMALKMMALEAAKLVNDINASLSSLDKGIRDLENTTDKIKDKSDQVAIGEANAKLAGIKKDVETLEGRAEAVRLLSGKMEREIKRIE